MPDDVSLAFLLPGPPEGSRGGLPFDVALSRTGVMSSQKIAEGVRETLSQVFEWLESTQDLSEVYEVDEVTLALSIDTEGSVSIGPLARGAVGGQVSLEATVRRRR